MLEMNHAFQISVLASGSTGNSLYLESAEKKVLVDAGLSGKKITSLLAEVNRKPEDLDAILVTHEHRDHIHGVGVLARKYKLPVYANEKTWEAMAPLIGNVALEQRQIFEMGKVLTFGDMDIESFGVSHDAAAPQFYRFYKDGRSFVMLTDTGYASDHVRGTIRNADAYLVESNHDLEMLRMGPYPWSLKQRILGDRGHLSNEDGALVMTDIIGDNTKRIYLGHLSKENNMKELAHMTMEETLTRYDLGVNYQFNIYDTDPECSTELFAI
ncbi:MBL fold metallo-hydrolase [Enterococcus pallens]|uniref:Metallo-beta-lactamase YycJ n=1 Tax=Enterococcus pallens ATCC BAA-351 TaxID=1158607 RepID=R2QS32_9ENTE|nr:MBL fold metallo-hydrolase [Enterococcus pallens]EOH98013.1 metallo-beta-lactamase YycJ [Enterococcus pallens ATCC BAA-351]EOU20568.1 metallo-beta-lactamase YycJ [Enterococcus pallens ATCC BAA-351]OJG80405.1 metallo-beta-lactamase YycJ [Enterococcus pallens]